MSKEDFNVTFLSLHNNIIKGHHEYLIYFCYIILYIPTIWFLIRPMIGFIVRTKKIEIRIFIYFRKKKSKNRTIVLI